MADPRQALIKQMMQTQRGSPDLPGPRAIQELQQTPTDSVIQQFLDQFGVARAENPTGPQPGEIPMPRPRRPDLEQGPMGPYSNDMPIAEMKTSDVGRAVRGDEYAPNTAHGEMTDEQMLDNVHSQMGGFDWEGGEGAPTDDDIKRAQQDPDLRKEFVKQFGGTPEEFQGEPDADDKGD